MTKAEATTVMIDVAMRRRPRNRHELKQALSVLESPRQSKGVKHVASK